jgi:hypothetical protein
MVARRARMRTVTTMATEDDWLEFSSGADSGASEKIWGRC